MNRTEAISLFRTSHLPLSEARAREPALAAAVDNAATAERTTILDRVRASLPPAAITALRDVDLRTIVAGGLGKALHDRLDGLVRGPGVPDVTPRTPTQPQPGPVNPSRPTPPTPQPEASSEAGTAALLDAAARLAQLEDPLPSEDTPLADIPFLRPGIDLGRLYVLADAVKLPVARAEVLAKSIPSPEAVTDAVLHDLVKKQSLTAAEARKVGAARVAFLLSDDSDALTGAIAGKEVPDLLAMRPAAWEAALRTANTKAPEGYTLGTWASELARRHAALAPSRALHGRLIGGLSNDIVPLQRVAAAWPGFKLDDVLSRAELAPAARRAAFAARLAPVAKLQTVHPDVEWLSLDYARDSEDLRALKLDTSFTPDEQKMLLASLKAQQRVHAITADVDTSIRLLEAGYHGAPSIALSRMPKLITDTGLAPEEAERVHFAAIEMLGLTANMAFGIHDLVKGPFGKLPVGNLGSGVNDYLAQIEGYAELFGSQAWCDCKHCSSILSPAAYFVDLMAFVDEHVREPLFTVHHPNHVLDLKVRRPDLWTLPLTCTNTDTLLPTLDIINEVLENFVATHPVPSSTQFAGELTNRVAIGDHVYRRTLHEAVEIHAFDQPFCLPYEQVGRLLGQVGRSRADLVAVLGGAATVSRLALSARERDLTFTKDEDRTRLTRYFDVRITNSGTVGAVEVPDLLRAIGLSRDELGFLVTSWFVRGPDAPKITAEKSSPRSVQNDVERISGLTAGVLDRMHRFVRLARAADLRFPELDLWMRGRGLASLDKKAGEQIARLLAVRATLGVDLEDTLALAGGLSMSVLDADGTSLFARRLARALKLSVAQLMQLLAFVADLPAGSVAGLDDLERVLAFVAMWRDGTRTLDALGVITGGPVLDPAVWLTAADVVAQVRAEGADAFRFADTVFATTLGLSETVSRAVITDNAARLEAVAGGWRLRADFSFAAALTVPADIDEPRIREVLRAYHLSTLLPERLARALKIDSARAEGLLAVAGTELEAPELVASVRGEGSEAPLSSLVDLLLRLRVLCAPAELDAEALAFVATHRAMFALDALPAIPAAAVWAVDRYARFTRAPNLAFGDLATALSRADFHTLLAAHGAAGFPDSQDATLARALRAEVSLASSVCAAVPADTTALGTLRRLAAGIDLARALGVSGDALPLLLSNDYAQLSQGADALVAGFRLRYPDEATATTQLDPIEDALRGRKRDALCRYILRSLAPSLNIPWGDRSDLYHHFLLDVDMGGCGRTSRLVSALSSLQLYVHRVRMNLEQDQRTDGGTPRVHVQLDKSSADEWTWRQNYRVWEANRKVFLWPENYLEPDLRDDKTDQFVELESTLLQQEINDQTVLDAYTRYLAGFEEVAKLRIGGAWYEASSSLDRLHLFGATSSDPPIWYYRSVDNLRRSRSNQSEGLRWGNWIKLNVQVPVRELAPVVFQGRLHAFWVEIRTKSINSEFKEGGSRFIGYDHTMRLKFTTLRPDGTWTAPQEVSLEGWPYKGMGAGVIQDRLEVKSWEVKVSGSGTVEAVVHQGPRLGSEEQTEPQDDYTLKGATWDRVVLDVQGDRLYVDGRNHRFQAQLDLFGRRLVAGTGTEKSPHAATSVLTNIPAVSNDRKLYVGSVARRYGKANAAAAFLLDERWTTMIDGEVGTATDWQRDGLFDRLVGSVPEDAAMHGVPRSGGAQEDAIIQVGVDPVLFHGSAAEGASARVVRLGTTLSDKVTRTLFEEGVDAILARDFQEALNEGSLPITLTSNLVKTDGTPTGVAGAKAVLRGPLGAWYQELFLHIPWRIALHLNAQGRYEAAQRWLHAIFDPTASDSPGKDRVWRYVGFRDLVVPTLRAILSDEAAIEAYKDDPFNPHAIARLRPSAYQKHMVMRYVDNLLDWADSLFTQFTTESINEAALLYVLASDILGERPPRLEDCGEGAPSPRDYEHIKPLLDRGSEFLIELQTWSFSKEKLGKQNSAIGAFGADQSAIVTAKDPTRKPGKRGPVFHGPDSGKVRTGAWKNPAVRDDKGTGARFESKSRVADHPRGPGFGALGGLFGWTLLKQTPVFCVPPNKELLAYWDHVEDRLGKIRSCRDINGVPRMPPLFAPEIDPRLLVRARALGLSLDEVLGGTGGALPPYRFLYLIEKAKGMAATVASFGAALLSALEKQDGEQLNRLRLVQQQNIAKLTTNLRRWDVQVAEEAVMGVNRQIEAATYRRDYYADLKAEGRTGFEVIQSTATHRATGLLYTAGFMDVLAAVLYLIPQLGSPMAMKYGGKEAGDSGYTFAGVLRDAASMQQAVATSASLEAGFGRRAEGWDHQRALAEHELNQLEHQGKIAALRLDITKRSLEIHEEGVAQIEEMFAFYDGKFTGLGLYTWLASTLQRVYRGAYNNALALARLADEAFRYERGTAEFMIDASYWDASHAGLGAGEQLLLALQSLERRFIETNHRSHEVDQAFSLQQVAPAAIMQLRETGTCVFDVPELFFDLAYPGHYRRRIKCVRLTIPCVTGPYSNISAILSLVQSHIRSDASGALVPFPVRRSVSVATSTAQNDAGVFELSFRDERYMPFEGAGAVSQWRLELPSAFRAFDYGSINDVILSISYTAEYDAPLRDQVQQANAALERSLLHVLQNNKVSRMLSLRHDFSAAFNRVLHSAAGTAVRFEIGDPQLPFFLAGRSLVVEKAILGVELAPDADPAGLAFTVDGGPLTLASQPDLGGMLGAPLPAAFKHNLRGEHTLVVVAGGGLQPSSPLPGDPSPLDDALVRDFVLFVEFKVAP